MKGKGYQEGHQNYGSEIGDAEDFTQKIGSLLTNKQTRFLGIDLLHRSLEFLDITLLERKANLWITLSFKAYCANEFEDNGALMFQLLAKFICRFQESANLYKTFENNHLSKLYETLNKSSEALIKLALPYVETCLRVYPITDTASRDLIDGVLNKLSHITDNDMSMQVGKCKQLLCQSRGHHEQNINRWQKYQDSLLSSIDAILDDMFSKCSGSYKDFHQYKKNINGGRTDAPLKQTSKYVHCHNLINYMITALRETFPVEKRIKPKKILNIINKGLSVTYLTLQQNLIAENIELSAFLPKLHLDLLNLLNALLISCRSHLKPHFQLVFNLLTDTLKWTTTSLSKNASSRKQALLILRAKAYDSLCLWFKVLRGGCRNPTAAEYLINEVLKDITPLDNKFVFEVLNTTRKQSTRNHSSKKVLKIQNEHSHLANSGTTRNFGYKKNATRNGEEQVCISALRCLQEICEKSASFLKPSTIKLIHGSVTKLCSQLYPPALQVNVYRDDKCRLELFKTLYSVFVATHCLEVGFSEIDLKILQIFQFCDGSVVVRNYCSYLLQIFEKIQHPQKETLLSPPDIAYSYVKVKNDYLFNSFTMNHENNYNSDDNVRHEGAKDDNENDEIIHDSEVMEEQNVSQQDSTIRESIDYMEIDKDPTVHLNSDEQQVASRKLTLNDNNDDRIAEKHSNKVNILSVTILKGNKSDSFANDEHNGNGKKLKLQEEASIDAADAVIETNTKDNNLENSSQLVSDLMKHFVDELN